MDDITRWSTLPEGQFFDRKSAFDRSGSRHKQRKASDVAWDIVETLSAMANADGGELVVGIEDDGTVTGMPHPGDKVGLFLRTPGDRNYIHPPLRYQAREVRTPDRMLLLHLAVEWSPEVHRLADGRYLLRVNDANMPFPAEQIAALKQTKAQGLVERSFPLGATLNDLDLDLVASLILKMQMEASPEELLRRYRLVEGRNGRSVPCLAGLLLFGKDPPRWHPRCGIDFVRWQGTERKHGAELNITKRIRIEHPLSILIAKAHETIGHFIGERQQLHDLFFTERLEYPTFVWQEAIVNAVAHRDYSIQGAQIEVWMFDDRIEVRSPGLPPHPVTVEALNRREHLHLSRNPLIVRILADLGYMRELGEGIPRMFAEMEREGFYPPRFDDIGGVSFQVTLRNQPVYDHATLEWLQRFSSLSLTGDQKRLLAYAHAHGGRFTSRDYQKLTGLDTYSASSSIKDLIRKGVVCSTEKGSRIYKIEELTARQQTVPDELKRLLPILQQQGSIQNKDVCLALSVKPKTATRLLDRLVMEGWLARTGERRGTRYVLRQHPL
ncbi:MAG: putative DNA binding domain-containing protein [Deltaproteobacteria bacterium]|nr:putative DNA binding domain-containing protein [Deltaproteobacteria bacterium]